MVTIGLYSIKSYSTQVQVAVMDQKGKHLRKLINTCYMLVENLLSILSIDSPFSLSSTALLLMKQEAFIQHSPGDFFLVFVVIVLIIPLVFVLIWQYCCQLLRFPMYSEGCGLGEPLWAGA